MKPSYCECQQSTRPNQGNSRKLSNTIKSHTAFSRTSTPVISVPEIALSLT